MTYTVDLAGLVPHAPPDARVVVPDWLARIIQERAVAGDPEAQKYHARLARLDPPRARKVHLRTGRIGSLTVTACGRDSTTAPEITRDFSDTTCRVCLSRVVLR